MAALTQDRIMESRWTGRMVVGRVAAGAVIRAGSNCGRNLAGFIVPAGSPEAVHSVGVAQESVSNIGGADGAKVVRLLVGVFKFKNDSADPVRAVNAHRLCFAADDQTVRATAGTGGVPAGVVDEIVSDGVWVYVDSVIAAT